MMGYGNWGCKGWEGKIFIKL